MQVAKGASETLMHIQRAAPEMINQMSSLLWQQRRVPGGLLCDD
jgi:hypothetical protein